MIVFEKWYEFAHGVHGHVPVFASLSTIIEFVPEDINVFLCRYEEVRVRLDGKVSADIVQGVEKGQADIGICWYAADRRCLHSIPYRSDRLASVVHPEHPLADRKKVAFEDTLDFEQVGTRPGSIVYLTLQTQAAITGNPIRYRIQVKTFDTVCRIVAANLAVAIVPHEVSPPFEQALGLKTLPLTNAWARRRFVICVRDYAALSVPAC